MKQVIELLLCLFVLGFSGFAQRNPSDNPVNPSPGTNQEAQNLPNAPVPGNPRVAPPSGAPAQTRLDLKGAEALALKNNPAISVARLTALASPIRRRFPVLAAGPSVASFAHLYSPPTTYHCRLRFL